VHFGDTTVTVNRVDGLKPGQHVTIGGGADVYTIVKVTLPAIDITPGVLIPIAPSEGVW
jgi:hypothetical protein